MDTPAPIRVLLLGPLPPPHIGPAVATQILLASTLRCSFLLDGFDTSTHRSLDTLGRWRLTSMLATARLYARFVVRLLRFRPQICIVPISQTTLGFLKDSVYLLIARVCGRQVLLHLRGSEFRVWLESRPAPLRSVARFLVQRADGVVVLGRSLRPLFSGIFPAERIFVVPNGADYELPRRRSADGTVRILHLSNLKKAKGVVDVVEAVARLRARQPDLDVELILAGTWVDEGTREECRLIADRAGLPLRSPGLVTGREKLQILVDADVFVFPPRQREGLPWVLVEALAAGLPVVATNQGAICDCVEDGCNGFLVPDGSPDAIAERLAVLCREESTRRCFGEASRRLYEARFTQERMVEAMSAAIKGVS